MDFFWHLFSHFCGQVHCARVGGVLLPVCERCMGLYAGGALSLVVIAWFRPKPTAALCWVHGLMLLVMAPFGYHLIPHGALVRIVTGLLFGFGLSYYLALNPVLGLGWLERDRGAIRHYGIALLAVILAVLAAVRFGGGWAAWLLVVCATAGLFAYAALVVTNLVVLSSALWARTHRSPAAFPYQS